MLTFFTRQHGQRTASLIVFLSSAAWGILWVPMRYADSLGLPPLWVQLMFVLGPAIIMVPLQWRSIQKARHHWPVYVAVGFLVAAGLACFVLGLLFGSVSKTTVLFYLIPIWVTIMGRMFLGERNIMSRWCAIAAALIGGCFVLQINPLDIRLETADIFGLASGMFWAGGAVILRRFPEVEFRNTTCTQYVIGVAMMLLAVWILEVPTPSADVVIATVPVMFFAGACVFLPIMLLLFRISQYLSPGLVSILMLSEILVAVVSSSIWLGEVISLWQALGVVLILGAGVFVAFGDNVSDDNNRALETAR